MAFTQSIQPSLLPRSWWLQGVLSGLAVAIWYGFGALLTRLGRLLRRRHGWGWAPWSPQRDLTVRRVALVIGSAVLVWSGYRAFASHRWTWDRLGYERDHFLLISLGALTLAAAVAALLFGLSALLRLLQRWLTRVGQRWLPAWIAAGLAFVLLGWAVLATLSNVVFDRTVDAFNAGFAATDLRVGDGQEPPTSDVRSAGPNSVIDWQEAGHQGRRFLSRGPSVEQIADVAPTDAGDVVEPSRVYVGRASADSTDERVALAMEDLERFDAFSRQAILVVIPTGTGWVNEQIVQPVEYFYGGDVATVSAQYSHLPSHLAFLSEEPAAGDTGRGLVDAVEARIAELPTDQQPDLLVAGESLGSFGGSNAFTSLRDMLDRTRATLWVGPPETMHLRREAERERVAGSTQVKPQVGDGEDIVFANRESDLAGTSPRSVFLQQADDPIVWWDWELAYEEPDWLREPLDPAVNPDMSWGPLTTFLNVAADMVVANDFDEDHGHLYGSQPMTAWQVMLQPEGWDEARLDELRQRLREVRR